MKNLKILLTNNLTTISNSIILVFVVLAFAGLLDASYISWNYFQDTVPPCTLGGCEQVLASPYSKVFGVPLALIGAVYYSVILLLALAYLKLKNNKIILAFLGITLFGFLFSVLFISLQVFVIGAVCDYCLISAAISTILFILTIFMARHIVKGGLAADFSG